MALSEEELLQLPEAIQAILRAQQPQAAPGTMGQAYVPSYQASGQQLQGDLQAAAGRRFGQQYGAEFDPTYNAEVQGLLGQVPQLQSGFESQRTRLGEDFSKGMQDLDRINQQSIQRHLESMADRGIGRSGANLIGQERIGETFQRGIQAGVQGRERGLQGLEQTAANAFQDIRSRLSQSEAKGTERSRVREEARRLQEEQQRAEQDRLKREQDYAAQAAAQAEADRAQTQQMVQQMAAANLAASQPYPDVTGSYGGGGGGSAPAFNTDTNVSVDFYEYNLRDPNEVRELQQYLGVPPDGVFGPQTQAALESKNAVYFNDRPVNLQTRNRNWRSL